MPFVECSLLPYTSLVQGVFCFYTLRHNTEIRGSTSEASFNENFTKSRIDAMYAPDEDPFLMNEELEESAESPSLPPQPKQSKAKAKQPAGNYHYQPHQSMYNMPPGGVPPPAGYPRPGPMPPRMYAGGPGFVPGGPGFVPGGGYMMPPQPYGAPPQMVLPPQPMFAPPAPMYPTTAAYRDRTGLSEQIEALEQYQRSRPASYGSGSSADNALLIATLVSEQDALYGTNMLENITPMDQEYIQSLMQRGVPEHEALRMAFDRKPHPPRAPKPVRSFRSIRFPLLFLPLRLSQPRAVDSAADAQALEEAIQLSLTESSRRASQPSYSSVRSF
jgi:hypothetical protein